MRVLTLRRFNNVLSVVVFLLGLYLLVTPFLPKATYRWKPDPPLVTAEKKGETPPPEAIPKDNTLVIPSMKLQQPILEGRAKWLIHKGVWHVPDTGAPGVGGNMVLTGHRFTYGGPAVFYHMDKVRVGDEIILYWQRQKLSYRVSRVMEVKPTQADVLKPTDHFVLTIYTCTPLITAKNRLVIQALPSEMSQ